MNELVSTLLSHTNYAKYCADFVVGKRMVLELYNIAAEKIPLNFSAEVHDQLRFRASYVLEKVYFSYREEFTPCEDYFFEDFPKITNASSKRHFAKMMVDLLKYKKPPAEQCEQIASACALWITEPKVRVAVQLNAVDVLIMLRDDVSWLHELLPDIFEPLKRSPSPAVLSRMKKWREKGALL